MRTPQPANLTSAIILAAVPMARSVATFLENSEFLWGGGRTQRLAMTSTELLQAVSKWRDGDYNIESALREQRHIEWRDLPGDAARLEKRLASLTLQQARDARRASGRRPDVLSLTCALLANHEAPWTHALVTYAMSLAVQSLYGVTNDEPALRRLWDAYCSLAARIGLQQRRRVMKKTPGEEPFLLDLLCMHGYLYRSVSGDNLSAYYAGFLKTPLGVDRKMRMRQFSPGEWPEVHGKEPDFPTVLGLAFNQPTCIPGIDEVTGGLMPTVASEQGFQPGGVITLLAGPPGSGKTTLAMSLAARMAEIGTEVVYLSAEESIASLTTKRMAVVEPNKLLTALWPDANIPTLAPKFKIEPQGTFKSLHELVDAIAGELSAPRISASLPGQGTVGFPQAVIIDSITVLLSHAENDAPRLHHVGRQALAGLLNRLRDVGVCVILIGETLHMHDSDVAYLVDNVFLLDVDQEQGDKHPLRVFRVEKTRLQVSYRGRHVFHISRSDGPVVSPSLHAVLRICGDNDPRNNERPARIVMWAKGVQAENRQQMLPGLETTDRFGDTITLRSPSHVLVYGWGTTGKARLAMSIAFEPQIPQSFVREYVLERSAAEDRRERPESDARWLLHTRVLVVSFLYDRDYYYRIAREMLRTRYRSSAGLEEVETYVTVEDLYPGYLDPETLVNRLRKRIASARLEGRPYTTVVVDGLHNMLLQFPLLANDPLLWPSVFRVLRSEGVSAVSTFTFFQVAMQPEQVFQTARTDIPSAAEQMFHHLLVSNCDYTLLVSRAGAKQRNVRVYRTTTVDSNRERNEFVWDGDALRCLVMDTEDIEARPPQVS